MKRESENYINEHVFIRNTNTFGKVPNERELNFYNIKDDFFNYNQE